MNTPPTNYDSLLWYLNGQFPATCGHTPLRDCLMRLKHESQSLLDRAEYAEQRNAELLTLMVSLGLLLKEHGLDGHPLAERIRECAGNICKVCGKESDMPFHTCVGKTDLAKAIERQEPFIKELITRRIVSAEDYADLVRILDAAKVANSKLCLGRRGVR